MNTMHIALQLKRHTCDLDVDLTLPIQGITALFGPSGSGKTTLLRGLAGLDRVKQGHIRVGESIWQNEQIFVPTHCRALGYVFQENSLFPHLSVKHNLEYGLKRCPKERQQYSFEQVVAWLGLSDLLKRQPHELSGGQRQKVAIGRAILTSPELLLMDEPLSNLDQGSKNEILPYLKRINVEANIPMIYVSHALSEVLYLADTLVLIDQGRITAVGSPHDLAAQLDFGFMTSLSAFLDRD
ncbi:molybdenum ABC transporter ATP-binding protein [Ephemeroptericola cinctiostellae]|nr:molybdenum ABC transporter ATP-binding protein [Ephemeroptericola cinctiostellae]